MTRIHSGNATKLSEADDEAPVQTGVKQAKAETSHQAKHKTPKKSDDLFKNVVVGFSSTAPETGSKAALSAAEKRMHTAIDTVTDLLTRHFVKLDFIVSDDDAAKALATLQGLFPSERAEVMKALGDAGLLSVLKDNLAESLQGDFAALASKPKAPAAAGQKAAQGEKKVETKAVTAKEAPPKKEAPRPRKTPTTRPKDLIPTVSTVVTSPTTPAKAEPGTKAVDTKTTWKSQYDSTLSDGGGDTSCNTACRAMMSAKHQPMDSSPQANFQVATSKDPFGRIVADVDVAKAGRAYLDGQLDSGLPVMVGVTMNVEDHGYNQNQADHFVVISGRGVDEAGRVYYSFHDPGTRHKNLGDAGVATNRFYVDEKTGTLYRDEQPEGRRQTTTNRLEVSQIRKNKE